MQIKYLYKDGVANADLTTYTFGYYGGVSNGNETANFGTDSIILRATQPQNTTAGRFVYCRTGLLDLTDITTIKMDCSFSQTTGNIPEEQFIVVSKQSANPDNSYALCSKTRGGSFSGTVELNVSSLSGEYYIYFNCFAMAADTAQLTITQISLE